MVREILSLTELRNVLKEQQDAYLLLYKEGAQQSDCAHQQYLRAAVSFNDRALLKADVTMVRDIHPEYGVQAVPVLLEFEGGRLKNIVKGCQQYDFYSRLFTHRFFITTAEKRQQAVNRVVVYSTPTCSWCTTLKRYLDEHRIAYSDVDVSSDQGKAEEMVKKSGQQGVPQTDINGSIVVGFDKTRINQLLNIKN